MKGQQCSAIKNVFRTSWIERFMYSACNVTHFSAVNQTNMVEGNLKFYILEVGDMLFPAIPILNYLEINRLPDLDKLICLHDLINSIIPNGIFSVQFQTCAHCA